MADTGSNRSIGQEHSQHDMMALASMASHGTPTAEQVGNDLRTQQWFRYLDEMIVRNQASNKIAYLASSVKSAMADNANKERKLIATKVTDFFVNKMCRVPTEGGDAAQDYTDQELSIPRIIEQMTSAGQEISAINEWISTNTAAQQWVSGVITGLAQAGACPPSIKDTRKYKRAQSNVASATAD